VIVAGLEAPDSSAEFTMGGHMALGLHGCSFRQEHQRGALHRLGAL
jgi:hypothetical protein